MSAPPDRAAARCACTNISLMQLFHELKQKFPGAPDHAVSGAISAYCHDKRACETHLESQAEASLTHAYHASSSAAARRLKDLRANLAPIECRNRPIEKRQFPSTATVHALACEKPLNAELSSCISLDDNSNNIEVLDATNTVCVDNENNAKLSEANNEVLQNRLEGPTPRVLSDESPITINIDNCVEKSGETPSDAETDDTTRGRSSGGDAERDPATDTNESTGSNYRILKSHKIKSNLNELERTKEKKVVKVKSADKKAEEPQPPDEGVSSDKPKRPCTLEFIKPLPDLNLKRQTIAEPAPEPCRALSPVPPAPEPVAPPRKDRGAAQAVGAHWPDQGYPLNLSVNVNCHMDIANNRPRTLYPDPWLEEYESPRAFTSVNLTVCTPTSAMQSPAREVSTGAADQRGFEGHVTVTVSPSTARPPRRRAPPPPAPASAGTHQQHFLPTPTLESTALSDGSLIARQRARKRLLVEELGRERERLGRVAREAAVLAAPLPPAAAARRLRQDVEWLREQCQRMTRALDIQNAGHERESDEYYTNLYTGAGEHGGGAAAGAAVPRAAPSRPAPAPPGTDDAPSWQCHVCTFRNHGLLNKCEECDMPRILLVRAGDEITVHLMPGPGRRKIVRSWVL